MLMAVSARDISTITVVAWEVLPGLPGEGPLPLHFHLGHPTPWTEGVVIRFTNSDGSSWIANFKGCGSERKVAVIFWEAAASIAVLVGSDFYLVDERKHESYTTLGEPSYATSIILNENMTMLFVADSGTVHAFDRDRKLVWSRSEIGGFVAYLKNCIDGILTVELEIEIDGPLNIVRLSAKDGTLL